MPKYPVEGRKSLFRAADSIRTMAEMPSPPRLSLLPQQILDKAFPPRH